MERKLLNGFLCSFIFLLLLGFKTLVAKAQSPNYVGDDCQNTTSKPLNNAYKTNLNSVLSWLSTDAATSKGYNHNSFGNNTPGSDAVYGLYDCRGDVVGYFCQFCVSTASREVLQRCPNRVSAIIWYDFCILRYSNENFFGNVTVFPSWHAVRPVNVSSKDEIQKGLDFMKSLIRKATVETNLLYYMDGFNLSSTQKRYGLVQCSRDLTNDGCRECLEAMLAQVPKCCQHNLGWQVLAASCLIKYDDYIFYLFRTQASDSQTEDVRISDNIHTSYHNVETEESLNLDLPTIPLITILENEKKKRQLNWNLRLNIINGIAKGILYLHEDSRLKVIHRDLKASNVLLDDEMNPKISDFGLARAFEKGQNQGNTNRVMGTYGYMAPEYAMEGFFSVKSDVFSYGVLVLEIICGRKNSGFYLSECGQSLTLYAWKIWCAGKCLELMDPVLEESCMESEVVKCIHIGLLCVQEDAADRPTMSNVVVMLASDTMSLPKPNQPAFSVGRMTFEDASTSKSSKNSVNDVTVSKVLPR
ncbi:hypothetical protein VNO78_07006 [Psophocarpus tetragonolobus]|uniref:Cysteine-rich receptor-like protein kinase 10 n=1 Tax=Psophocarpus tetragonolobus TaxID=3891 RepID=A0AAN9T2E1_PSOTE